MPVFSAIFERVAGNLLSVDGSATQLPAILLAMLLGVDAPLNLTIILTSAFHQFVHVAHADCALQSGILNCTCYNCDLRLVLCR